MCAMYLDDINNLVSFTNECPTLKIVESFAIEAVIIRWSGVVIKSHILKPSCEPFKRYASHYLD